MNSIFFAKGFLIGLGLAAPVGPIGILCIRRSLTKGRLAGFVSGLGAATADAVFGGVAAFGLTFVSSFLLAHQLVLRIIGGIFLCALGIHIFTSKPSTKAASTGGWGTGLLASYFSTFFLTLSNPATVISFAAIFATFGIEDTAENLFSAALLVTGVFAGSTFWWLLLSNTAYFFRFKIKGHILERINKISGIGIIIFGVLTILSVLKS